MCGMWPGASLVTRFVTENGSTGQYLAARYLEGQTASTCNGTSTNSPSSNGILPQNPALGQPAGQMGIPARSSALFRWAYGDRLGNMIILPLGRYKGGFQTPGIVDRGGFEPPTSPSLDLFAKGLDARSRILPD